MTWQGVFPKKLAGGHTIVGCDVASCALVADFLEEFFHEDHGYNISHLVRDAGGRVTASSTAIQYRVNSVALRAVGVRPLYNFEGTPAETNGETGVSENIAYLTFMRSIYFPSIVYSCKVMWFC